MKLSATFDVFEHPRLLFLILLDFLIAFAVEQSHWSVAELVERCGE